MPIPYDNEEVIQTAGTAWAVTATHNFLDQSITGSTPLITAGHATPGIGYYTATVFSSGRLHARAGCAGVPVD